MFKANALRLQNISNVTISGKSESLNRESGWLSESNDEPGDEEDDEAEQDDVHQVLMITFLRQSFQSAHGALKKWPHAVKLFVLCAGKKALDTPRENS